MSTLKDKTNTSDPVVYYNPKFLASLQLHKAILQGPKYSVTIPLEPQRSYAYTGDFYGLLLNYNIPSRYHQAVMIMNDILDPCAYDGSLTQLLVPSDTFIDELARSFLATSG